MNYTIRPVTLSEVLHVASKIPQLKDKFSNITDLANGVKYLALEYNTYKIIFSLEHKGEGYEGHIAIMPEHRKVARQLTKLVCLWVFTSFTSLSRTSFPVSLEQEIHSSISFSTVLSKFCPLIVNDATKRIIKTIFFFISINFILQLR